MGRRHGGRRRYPPAGFNAAMRNREQAYREQMASGGCIVTFLFPAGLLAGLIWLVSRYV